VQRHGGRSLAEKINGEKRDTIEIGGDAEHGEHG
jgi:hypothetical protein